MVSPIVFETSKHLLLTLNIFFTFFQCFYCWLWTVECLLAYFVWWKYIPLEKLLLFGSICKIIELAGFLSKSFNYSTYIRSRRLQKMTNFHAFLIWKCSVMQTYLTQSTAVNFVSFVHFFFFEESLMKIVPYFLPFVSFLKKFLLTYCLFFFSTFPYRTSYQSGWLFLLFSFFWRQPSFFLKSLAHYFCYALCKLYQL